MHGPLDRRQVLKTLAGVSAAAIVPGALTGCANPHRGGTSATASTRRAMRIAHLTDIHIQPELGATEGFARCLDHVQSQPDRPDLIITGGDLIFDGFERDEARTRLQWELFTKTLRDHTSIPVRHCLGNHDIWGWNKKKSGTTGSEPMWGKKWAVEALELEGRYHSFDQNGWHIVVLDSTHPDPENPDGYIALLDDEQADWLARDLNGRRARNVMVVSHIPIASAVALFPWVTKSNTAADKAVQRHRELNDGWMHTDNHRMRMLFRDHGQVRLCLSGHLHRTDRVDFEGSTYLCGGAVSGSWWKGPNDLTREGYNLVDLFDDGSFTYHYVEYGWTAKA